MAELIISRQPNGHAGGFVLGLALGVLYVSCAGPILAAITVVGATHRVGLAAVFLTAAFAVGTAVPLLAVAVAGSQLGVHYPVAVGDDYGTWNACDNEYWPADYLVDAQGNVRHVTFGEGGYSTTGRLIRQLLAAAHPHLALPAATGVPNLTPTGEMSPCGRGAAPLPAVPGRSGSSGKLLLRASPGVQAFDFTFG